MSQTRLLARTFFSRLFESDLMPDGLPQVQLVLWSAILAATPTSGYPLLLADKYQSLVARQSLAGEFDADRMILITLSMMMLGGAALIIWDGVFPDRRDVRVLGSLPVPTRRFVAARLLALAQVYLVFAIPVCVLQSVVFPNLVAGFGDPVSRFTGMASHLVAVSLASAFVFAALVAAQCVLLVAVGRRFAQHVSTAFQLLFAIGLVQLFVFLPDLGRALRSGGDASDGLRALAALPPTWFFGLYELMAGTADAESERLGRIGLAAAAGTVLFAAASYALSYDVLSKRALEGPPSVRRTRRRRLGLLDRLPVAGAISPARAAVRRFMVQTLARSRHHRMMLAVYAGIALAIVFSSAVSVAVRQGGAGLWRPGVAMASMPLIVQFLMLIGLRVMVAVPSEPRARWTFRASEPPDRAAALAGARDAMMLLVVLPTGLFAWLQGAIFWSAPAAISHAIFCVVVGRLFTDLLLLRMDKLPFACTYFPGKSRVFTLWPLYVLAFFVYALLLAGIDVLLMTRPAALAVVCVAVLAASTLARFIQRRMLTGLESFRYEEEDPDMMFQGFNLSEGIAAASKPPSSSDDDATDLPKTSLRAGP